MTANSTDFAVLLTKYFSDYLPLQRGYSENTIASYSTSFKLLLNYANQREKIRAQIKMELAQYRELASFSQFGSDVDADTKARLDHGAVLMEIIKQGQYKPMPVEYQVVSIFAAVNGFMQDIQIDRIGEFEKNLIEYMELNERPFLDQILEEGKLSDAMEQELRDDIVKFRKTQKSDMLIDSQKALRHEELAEEDAAIEAARAEAEKAL